MTPVSPEGSTWLRALLDHPHAILFSLDAKGRITWVSPQVKAILGLDPELIVGQKAIAGLVESHRATAEAHQRAKADGQEDKATYETVLRAGDGREVWLELTSQAERDAAGNLLAVHGFAVDITEQRNAREALERSRRRMNDILDDANDIIYLHNLEGHFMTVNAAAVATYGYTRDEFLRMSIRDLVDPAHLSKAAEEMRLKIEGKKTRSAAYELLTRGKDGHAVWVEVSTRAVLRDGKAVAIQGIARDVTRRKGDEAALRLVHRIAMETSEAPDFDTALAMALEGLVEATGCSRAEAWAPGADARLHLAAAWPEDRPPQVEKFHRLSQRADFGLSDGIAGRAWREGRSVWLSDLGHDPTFLRAASARAAGFGALMAVPILADGSLVALLVMFLNEPKATQPHWTALVESVAAQLGAVLGRRHVEDRLRTQNDVLYSQWLDAPLSILLVGSDGQILGANHKFLRLCGIEPAPGPPKVGAEFMGAIADPVAFSAKASLLYELRGTGADEVHFEKRILRRFMSDLKGPDGTSLGKAVYLRDITEVRAMEMQLAAFKQSRSMQAKS